MRAASIRLVGKTADILVEPCKNAGKRDGFAPIMLRLAMVEGSDPVVQAQFGRVAVGHRVTMALVRDCVQPAARRSPTHQVGPIMSAAPCLTEAV